MTQHSTPPNSETLNEYEQLKNKNRRRLIGAGALTLLAGGLFAAVASNGPKESPKPVMVQTQKVTTEILRPDGKGKNASATASTEDVSESTPSSERTTQHTAATVPTLSQAQQASSTNKDEKQATSEAAQQLTNMLSTQPLSHDIPPPSPVADTSSNEASNSASDLRRQQREARRLAREQRRLERQKQREEAAKKQEAEQKAKELARQKAEQERIAQARADEERRRQAQAIAAKAEAERNARRQAAAEKARQAQQAAEQLRKAERAKLLAQKQAAEKMHQIAEQHRQQQQAQSAKKNVAKVTEVASNSKASVQVGAFSDLERARQAQQKLRSLNYSSHIEEVQTRKGKLYRVQTGTFPNRQEAELAAGKIKGRGLGNMIVEHKK